MSFPDKISASKAHLPSRTEYHRMNFLLQASALMHPQQPHTQTPGQNVSSHAESLSEVSSRKKKAQKTPLDETSDETLNVPAINMSRALLYQAKLIAKKAVLRLDPQSKRRICRRCWAPLTAGSLCTVRFRRSKNAIPYMITTCTACGFVSRLRMDPERSLHSDSALPQTA